VTVPLINTHLKIGSVVIDPFFFFVIFTPEKEIEKAKKYIEIKTVFMYCSYCI
jgi:hypothetical protein